MRGGLLVHAKKDFDPTESARCGLSGEITMKTLDGGGQE